MTPPNLQEIFDQSFWTPQEEWVEIEEARQNIPLWENTTQVTLDELKNWIHSISTDDSSVLALKDMILSFELDWDITIESYRTQIERLFWTIRDIPESELSMNLIVVTSYLQEVERLYDDYQNDIWAAERDSEIRREWIIPAEISDSRAQYQIFRESIRNLFAETEHLNNNQLFAAIESVQLNRSIDIDDIDRHFELLLTNARNNQEREIVQSFINDFKSQSEFYQELERWEDFSLREIWRNLDWIAREIISSESQSPFTIELEGDTWEFESQREALLMIYQLKLHLSEMEPYLIPYFFEQYGSYIGSGIWIVGGLLIAFWWPLIIYYYIKNKLQDHMWRINEWLTRDDIARLTNNTDSGVLDETIRWFEADWFNDNEVRNLRNLANFLRAEQTPQSWFADREMLRTNSDAYRQFARFRWSISYIISSIYRMNNPIWQHRENGTIIKESPFRPRNIVWLIIWSYNKWPDWWRMQTQRQIFERYIERFREFNEMMTRVDEILIAHWKSDEKRLQVRQEIRRLFIRGLGIPLVHPQRVSPFRNRAWGIMRVLNENWVDTNSTDARTLQRRLEWRIDTNIKSRIEHIRTIIHYHPSITDANERRIIRQLDWIQHDETPQRFNDDVNRMLGELNIEGMRNQSELRDLRIAEDLRLSRTDLDRLKVEIPRDANNYMNILRYLTRTTEWHKWLIYLNIARIMRWENELSSINLNEANLIAEDLRNVPLDRMWSIMETEQFRRLALINIGAAEPERGAAEPERGAATELFTLEQRIDDMRTFLTENNLDNLLRPWDITDETTLNSAIRRVERLLARDYFDRILMTLEIQWRTTEVNRLTSEWRIVSQIVDNILHTVQRTDDNLNTITLFAPEIWAINIDEIYSWERIWQTQALPRIEDRMNTFSYTWIRRNDIDLREISTRISFWEALQSAIRRLRR